MNFTPPNILLNTLILTCVALVTSCDTSARSSVELVDLDVVLENFVKVSEEMPPVNEADSDESIPLFIENYTKRLNEVNLMSTPVGVIHVSNDGSFLGFKDVNADGTKDIGDSDLFKVEVYGEEKKLIASDLVHSHKRDHGYRGGTFLAGYLVSRMMFGQSLGGISSNKFKNMKMDNAGYHKNAASSLKKAASPKPVSKPISARSSSGSKSFRSGK